MRLSSVPRDAAICAAVVWGVIAGTTSTAWGAAAHAHPAAASASAAAPVASWGTAQGVPSPSGLDLQFGAVSCSGPGDCAVVGRYFLGTEDDTRSRGFVMDERSGTWGPVTPVPGLAALDTRDAGGVNAVVCSSPGNCTAAGTYMTGSQELPFVVDQKNGHWGTATRVPDSESLDVGDYAVIASDGLSCSSTGNCSLIGTYLYAPTQLEEQFVATETGGVWGDATELAGIATAPTASFPDTGEAAGSVSCGAPGDCTAVGTYSVRPNGTHAFVATETDGRWGAAAVVAGPADEQLDLGLVACAAPGDCAADGRWSSTPEAAGQAIIVAEAKGTWGAAGMVPGIARLEGKGGTSAVASLACTSPGNCTAVGGYQPAKEGELPFAVTETDGRWGNAMGLSGIPADRGGPGGPLSGAVAVSCPSAGNCSAGGSYRLPFGNIVPFVDDEKDGTWRAAQPIAGLADNNGSNSYDSEVTALSCATPGYCTAVGLDTLNSVGNFLVDKVESVSPLARKLTTVSVRSTTVSLWIRGRLPPGA
jgi:hypothetical protein